MKKTSILTLTAGILLGLSVNAQVRTPQPSPAATVMQTVGITDITVKYSRPAMKGREIFGKLIPYDKVWRTGANQATNIELSTETTVGGQKLPAGKYSIVSFPGASEWTVVFSKDLAVNEGSYKEENDVIRIKAKSYETAVCQSFTIDFSDVTDSTANLNFAWERTKVSLPVAVATTDLTVAGIDKVTETSANQMNAGANYLLSKGKSLDKALGMVNAAVSAKETFRNLWTKAQILSKLGNFAEALPLAQKALSLGSASNDPAFGFMKDGIQKGIEEYTSKIPALPAVLPGKKKK